MTEAFYGNSFRYILNPLTRRAHIINYLSLTSVKIFENVTVYVRHIVGPWMNADISAKSKHCLHPERIAFYDYDNQS